MYSYKDHRFSFFSKHYHVAMVPILMVLGMVLMLFLSMKQPITYSCI